jgi:hypothetical protein
MQWKCSSVVNSLSILVEFLQMVYISDQENHVKNLPTDPKENKNHTLHPNTAFFLGALRRLNSYSQVLSIIQTLL